MGVGGGQEEAGGVGSRGCQGSGGGRGGNDSVYTSGTPPAQTDRQTDRPTDRQAGRQAKLLGMYR